MRLDAGVEDSGSRMNVQKKMKDFNMRLNEQLIQRSHSNAATQWPQRQLYALKQREWLELIQAKASAFEPSAFTPRQR